MADKPKGRVRKTPTAELTNDARPPRSGRKSVYTEFIQNLMNSDKKSLVIADPTTSTLLSLRKAIVKYDYKDVLDAYVDELGAVVVTKKSTK